jgi:hypothetical protein
MRPHSRDDFESDGSVAAKASSVPGLSDAQPIGKFLVTIMAAGNLAPSTLVLCVNAEHLAKPLVFPSNPWKCIMTTTRPRPKSRKTAKRSARNSSRRWSKQVTEHSDALDLKRGVFSQEDPAKIAASLKRSAERSKRRKADPYRSALSMLTFYINRAGRNLPASRKKTLNAAKQKLREKFGRAS